MRFTRIVALFLTLAVPCAAFAQQSKKPRPNSRTTAVPQPPPQRPSSPPPPRMTPEKAFFHFVAMNGFGQVYPAMTDSEIIRKYGETFDGENYKRAMADEFERDRYWKRIVTKVMAEVRKIDFNEKFTFEGGAELGEYSFKSGSFPIVAFPSHKINISGLDVTAFTTGLVVNGNDFNWSLLMSETDASAFVKNRSTGGAINRNIVVRITYSIADTKGEPLSYEYDIKWRPRLNSFIYSVELFNDSSLTRKLGILPKTNLLGPNTEEEWHLAAVAAQTPTKEIGKYRYIIRNQPDGKIRNPLSPLPRRFGTIVLTNTSIVFDEPPIYKSQKTTLRFFDTWGSSLSRRIVTYSDWRGEGKTISVSWSNKIGRFQSLIDTERIEPEFETIQERDRFFDDLKRTYQEWKTKYAPFQFAAGKFDVDDRCKLDDRIVPCSASTPSGTESESPSPTRKPVFETPTYRVTVESLERNANNYTATLVFENLTDETIKIAWQEKSNLVPDATGPYLIDESGEKYFAKGTDSGNILQDTMKFLWVPLTEILPKTKLTSRFLFIGNGNGRIFILRAKELKGLGPEDPVTIEGLKISNQTELPFPTPSVSPAPIEETSIDAPVTAPTKATTNPRSFETLSAAIEKGEEVVFNVKYNSAISGYLYLASGKVTVSKAAVSFDFTYGPEDLKDFTVSPDKILDVVSEPQQSARIHIKAAVKNKKGNKESIKDFYFYSPGAVAVGTGPGGIGGSISCRACDDSMSVLFALLQKVRGKS